MNKFSRIVIAYACEDSGSEPGVGFYWTKAIAKADEGNKVLLLTRKNNKVFELTKLNNIEIKGIDLPSSLLFIKRIIGVRLYYIIWQFLVFSHIIINFRNYKSAIIHQVTFTPLYYPPIFFLLPLKFIWGPLGGGETYPLAYLKSLKLKDRIKEIVRQFIRHSIYINPIFYFACFRSVKIICSTPESASMFPKMFRKKVEVELMVFDSDKEIVQQEKEKTIIIANRLIDWKMTHLFVESFYEFKKDNKTGYKLLVIGDGPYYDKIEKFIDGKTVIHFKRFEERIEMLSLLKKASLFVSMSLRDSGAASLLEAMSYGIPFLVSNSGAHKVYLEKGIGYSFNLKSFSEDKVKIKNILKNILYDKQELAKESDKVLNCFYSYFSENKKTKRIKKTITV